MAAFRFVTQIWFQLLLAGAILFFGSEQALRLTGNLNLVPTVILLGASVVPVAFVAYFFTEERLADRALHGEVSLPLVLVCLVIGGAIGVLAAGTIEYATLRTLSISGLLFVAVIEESAKLIIPVVIYVFSRFRSRADGLLFGVASGMGFAALETMGYGLAALINSQGNVGTLEETLLVRGLLSPVGHAAWTGFVCGVLWGSRQRTGKAFNPIVIPAFAVAIALHALWDIFSSASSVVVTFVGYAIIGGVSLGILIAQLRSARHNSPARTIADDSRRR